MTDTTQARRRWFEHDGARGEITVKDMSRGDQVSLPRSEAAAGISRLLSRSGHEGR